MLWRERNRLTFEDVECSVTQLHSLLIRTLFDWSQASDFTHSNSIVEFKESLYFYTWLVIICHSLGSFVPLAGTWSSSSLYLKKKTPIVRGVTNYSYFFELLYSSRRHDGTVERLRWKFNIYMSHLLVGHTICAWEGNFVVKFTWKAIWKVNTPMRVPFLFGLQLGGKL